MISRPLRGKGEAGGRIGRTGISSEGGRGSSVGGVANGRSGDTSMRRDLCGLAAGSSMAANPVGAGPGRNKRRGGSSVTAAPPPMRSGDAI
jgi:hypothetical protein